MNVKDGTLAVKGHRNHMDAINSVFASGSIKNMVKKGNLKKGIMYECVKRKIPFVLAGSIRDDGPIPDVITDVVKAQKMYKKVLKDAKMVMMVSTMLHSIATGNMLPADVKVIIVDINQPTVTKLMDRGTWQALGIVTDVVKAQKMYKKVLKDAKMVMMVSTMLHSIATGNMLPADVKVIIVDINQPTVTKLMDRGTWQALGIVTDVGAFMPMLAEQIRKKK